MTQALAPSPHASSAVYERRPRWSKDPDAEPSAAAEPTIDAHRREATVAFSVFSWTSMRAAVTRPADAPTQGTSRVIGGAPNTREHATALAGD